MRAGFCFFSHLATRQSREEQVSGAVGAAVAAALVVRFLVGDGTVRGEAVQVVILIVDQRLVSIRTLLRFVVGSVAIVSVRSALGLVVCARVFSAINDEFPDTVTANFAAAKANVFGVFKVPVVSLHLHRAPWLDDNGVEIVRCVHPALMFIPRSLEAKPPAVVRLSQDIKVVAPMTVLLGGPIAVVAIHLSTILTAVAPCLAFFIRVIVVNVMRFASRRVA